MKKSKPLCVFMCIVMLICSFPFYCVAESPAYSQLMEQEPVFVMDSTFEGIVDFYKNSSYSEILSSEQCNYINDKVAVKDKLVDCHVYMRTFNITDAGRYTSDDAKEMGSAVYQAVKDEISNKYIKCIARSFSISVKGTLDKRTDRYKTLKVHFFIATGESNEEREQVIQQLVRPTVSQWAELDDAGKLLALNDFILSGEFSYDMEQINRSSVYAFFQERLGVCEEFAGLTALFLDEMGYTNYLVTGKVAESLHIWNMVQINGRIYHLDILHNTAVDAEGKVGQITRDNLLVSTETITKSRTVDEKYSYLSSLAVYDFAFENTPSQIVCDIFEKNNGMLYRIPLFTTVRSLKELIGLDGFLFIESPSGELVSDDSYVGSGCSLILNVNGTVLERLVLCVDGDVDGDGIAAQSDLDVMSDVILRNFEQVSDEVKFFCDITEDGNVTVTDYITMSKLVAAVADYRL